MKHVESEFSFHFFLMRMRCWSFFSRWIDEVGIETCKWKYALKFKSNQILSLHTRLPLITSMAIFTLLCEHEKVYFVFPERWLAHVDCAEWEKICIYFSSIRRFVAGNSTFKFLCFCLTLEFTWFSVSNQRNTVKQRSLVRVKFPSDEIVANEITIINICTM